MIKYLYAFLIVFLFSSLYSQSIEGLWITYDDASNEKKSVVEIYASQGKYEAKIIETFTGVENEVCETCKGKYKGKPIIDMIIIKNLTKTGNTYSGGTIMDPESGETYKCFLELVEKDRLKVRGYIGFSLFGRTQFWERKSEITSK